MAEYIENDVEYGRARLEAHILGRLALPTDAPVGSSHDSLARLPIDQIWTTNYDSLLERALLDRRPTLVTTDDEIRNLGSTRTSIIKMHGSINDLGGPTKATWAESPVITRGDYERYEIRRPRTWALLRAAYMSRTFLFIGFSFTDPNVEILQRLARLNETARGDQHFAILRRPDESDAAARRLFDLQAADLSASGVRVHTIEDHAEVEIILQALVRRTRPARLFVSGSFHDDDTEEVRLHFIACSEAIGALLAERTNWEVASLQGPAGWFVSRTLGRMRQVKGTYDASKIAFHFRGKEGPPPPLVERIGTATYTDMERAPLARNLLDQSRAVLVIRGGTRTEEEVAWGLERGVGVVPLAASGGYAQKYWNDRRGTPPDLGGQPTNPDTWERLGSENLNAAADAAKDLLAQAMYAPTSC